MKTALITLFTTMALAWLANGQPEKGSWLATGVSTLGIACYKADAGTDKLKISDLGGRVGYFPLNRVAVGAHGEIIRISNKDVTRLRCVGFFSRYYVRRAFVGVGYNSLSQTGQVVRVGSVPIEMGYSLKLLRKSTIEPQLVFTWVPRKNQQELDSPIGLPLPVRSSITLRIGITLYQGNPHHH